MANFLNWVLVAVFFACQLEARDLGSYGLTASIEEEDLLYFLNQQLQNFSEEDRQLFTQAMRNTFTSHLFPFKDF